ncbi:MAG TPA: DUF2905 domain-containing protein [Pirellulales bacterium]|jgi:hypothetical protein|nr:DUF2905 domain-containing protein [Pirellulales bacterium]
MQGLGGTLLVIGCVIAMVGAILMFVPAVPLGRLPGDIRIESEHTRIYFPIVTCPVLSVILSLLMCLVRSFLR